MCTSLSILPCRRYPVSRVGATRIAKLFSRSSSGGDKNLLHLLVGATTRSRRFFFNADGRREYGSAAIASSALPGALSKQQAKDLAVRLTSVERDVLISALQECQSHKVKAEYEGKSYHFGYLFFFFLSSLTTV